MRSSLFTMLLVFGSEYCLFNSKDLERADLLIFIPAASSTVLWRVSFTLLAPSISLQSVATWPVRPL